TPRPDSRSIPTKPRPRWARKPQLPTLKSQITPCSLSDPSAAGTPPTATYCAPPASPSSTSARASSAPRPPWSPPSASSGHETLEKGERTFLSVPSPTPPLKPRAPRSVRAFAAADRGTVKINHDHRIGDLLRRDQGDVNLEHPRRADRLVANQGRAGIGRIHHIADGLLADRINPQHR